MAQRSGRERWPRYGMVENGVSVSVKDRAKETDKETLGLGIGRGFLVVLDRLMAVLLSSSLVERAHVFVKGWSRSRLRLATCAGCGSRLCKSVVWTERNVARNSGVGDVGSGAEPPQI